MTTKKRFDRVEAQDRLDVILKYPWIEEIVKDKEFSNGKVHRFTDYQKKWKKHNSTVHDHLKILCNAGILVKTDKGYVSSTKTMEKYISKFHDFALINDCPTDCVFSLTFPNKKGHGTKWEIVPIGVTIYGLEKRNSQIETILEKTYKNLEKIIHQEYTQKIESIVIRECKHIQQRELRKSVKEWGSIISQDILLSRMLHSMEPKYSQPIYNPPEKFEEEFKEITERIWDQFNRECSPIGIMVEFSTLFKLRRLNPIQVNESTIRKSTVE